LYLPDQVPARLSGLEEPTADGVARPQPTTSRATNHRTRVDGEFRLRRGLSCISGFLSVDCREPIGCGWSRFAGCVVRVVPITLPPVLDRAYAGKKLVVVSCTEQGGKSLRNRR